MTTEGERVGDEGHVAAGVYAMARPASTETRGEHERTHRGTRLFVTLLVLLSAACRGNPSSPSIGGPSIVRVEPANGTSFGGTSVIISGERFVQGASVTIGGLPATSVTVVDATTLTAVTPAHQAGTADITIANPQLGSTTAHGLFTFVAPQVVNTPPVVSAIQVQGSRRSEPANYANVQEAVRVTAMVTDAETSRENLTYEWSTTAGSVSGSGPSVIVIAPATPVLSQVTVTVIEHYSAPDESGLPKALEHRVSASASLVVRDEVAEIGGMAKRFLQLFSQSSVDPITVVQDFQEGCGANGTGRKDELTQTVDNRRRFDILPDWGVGNPSTTVGFDGSSPFRARRGDAWTVLTVAWNSRCKAKDDDAGCPAAGFVRQDAGNDWVTARYDAPTRRWWLCDSDYDPRGSSLRDLTAGSGKPYLR